MEKVMSPAVLWQDFNPEAELLDVDVLKKTEIDGLVWETLYFTGRTFDDGTKSRVYAVVCRKNTDSAKPAVLYIGDPASPPNLSEAEFLAKSGFIAVVIDFSGTKTNGPHTIYPERVFYADCMSGAGEFDINGETARDTVWFEYALNASRAVTLASSLFKVNSVSVITFGKGYRIGIAAAGADIRIDRIVTVSGELYDLYPESELKTDNTEDEEDMNRVVREDECRQMWTVGLAAQSYLPRLKAPVYALCGGNSLLADVTVLSEAFSRAGEECRLSVYPEVMDCFPQEAALDAVKWLKGKTASSGIDVRVESIKEGVMTFFVSLPDGAEKPELWYCRGTGRSKFWIKGNLYKENDALYADAEIYEHGSEILAVVSYRGDIRVSSRIFSFTADDKYNLKQPASLLYSGGDDIPFVPFVINGGWHDKLPSLVRAKGYLGIVGVKGRAMATFAVSDKCIKHTESDAISFDVCCDGKRELVIYCLSGFVVNPAAYFTSVTLTGDGKWQKVTVEAQNFKKSDGHLMTADVSADAFVFESDGDFILNNVFLV